MSSHSSEKTLLYYFLAIIGSLSSAGASMTLIALSASLYAVDQEGTASSSIYVLNYFGIGLSDLQVDGSYNALQPLLLESQAH